MARGPKKHLKRLNAPKHWMLSKMGGVFATKPSAGPHKARECLPLTLVLRNRLKYALTRRECQMIVMRRHVKIDHKVRTDMSYPCGFQDVITIDKTSENFRLLYDTKGRFVLHRITPKEAAYKLCRVKDVSLGSKAYIGTNPFVAGSLGAIPYLTTHDGRTIRYPDPQIDTSDTIKLDIKTGKILDFVKFDMGNVCLITAGANQGRVGIIVHREKHPGSHEIIHIKDKKDHAFATRGGNVFVIGRGDKPLISLPKGNGIKMSITEERAKRMKK
jgi:small subunit ribosomal protein S4e